MRFTEPEFIELRLGGFSETFGFIDEQHDRSISAAQMLRDADILRRQTGTGVGQEKNNVGLLNRKLGLPAMACTIPSVRTGSKPPVSTTM